MRVILKSRIEHMLKWAFLSLKCHRNSGGKSTLVNMPSNYGYSQKLEQVFMEL
jgi:hypothetical protein